MKIIREIEKHRGKQVVNMNILALDRKAWKNGVEKAEASLNSDACKG